jgi:hypothetical protein
MVLVEGAHRLRNAQASSARSFEHVICTGIYMLQEFCRRVGIAATDDGIRDLITAAMAAPTRA